MKIYRWVLYQIEDAVTIALDFGVWAADSILLLPWNMVLLSIVALSFVYLLTL